MKPVVGVVSGVTASGKSVVGVELALALGGAIVSADSRQVYRGLTVGTNVLPEDERKGVPHRGLGLIAPSETFSAGQFMAEFNRAYAAAVEAGQPVLWVVGGTGLYLQAVEQGFHPLPEVPQDIREAVRALAQTPVGLAALLVELRDRDPALYDTIDRNNPHRVARAVELCRTTGQPVTLLRKQPRPPVPYPVFKLCITRPQHELEQAIAQRTATMYATGLLDETRELVRTYPPTIPALQIIGYREALAYIRGDHSRERAVELTRLATRQYAKRQRTWIDKYDNHRQLAGYAVFQPSELDQAIHWARHQLAHLLQNHSHSNHRA
jgi:tRNA dimethylallyltransferase